MEARKLTTLALLAFPLAIDALPAFRGEEVRVNYEKIDVPWGVSHCCEDHEVRHWTTKNDHQFKIACDPATLTSESSAIALKMHHFTEPSLQGCIETCSTVSRCAGLYYNSASEECRLITGFTSFVKEGSLPGDYLPFGAIKLETTDNTISWAVKETIPLLRQDPTLPLGKRIVLGDGTVTSSLQDTINEVTAGAELEQFHDSLDREFEEFSAAAKREANIARRLGDTYDADKAIRDYAGYMYKREYGGEAFEKYKELIGDEGDDDDSVEEEDDDDEDEIEDVESHEKSKRDLTVSPSASDDYPLTGRRRDLNITVPTSPVYISHPKFPYGGRNKGEKRGEPLLTHSPSTSEREWELNHPNGKRAISSSSEFPLRNQDRGEPLLTHSPSTSEREWELKHPNGKRVAPSPSQFPRLPRGHPDLTDNPSTSEAFYFYHYPYPTITTHFPPRARRTNSPSTSKRDFNLRPHYNVDKRLTSAGKRSERVQDIRRGNPTHTESMSTSDWIYYENSRAESYRTSSPPKRSERFPNKARGNPEWTMSPSTSELEWYNVYVPNEYNHQTRRRGESRLDGLPNTSENKDASPRSVPFHRGPPHGRPGHPGGKFHFANSSEPHGHNTTKRNVGTTEDVGKFQVERHGHNGTFRHHGKPHSNHSHSGHIQARRPPHWINETFAPLNSTHGPTIPLAARTHGEDEGSGNHADGKNGVDGGHNGEKGSENSDEEDNDDDTDDDEKQNEGHAEDEGREENEAHDEGKGFEDGEGLEREDYDSEGREEGGDFNEGVEEDEGHEEDEVFEEGNNYEDDDNEEGGDNHEEDQEVKGYEEGGEDEGHDENEEGEEYDEGEEEAEGEYGNNGEDEDESDDKGEIKFVDDNDNDDSNNEGKDNEDDYVDHDSYEESSADKEGDEDADGENDDSKGEDFGAWVNDARFTFEDQNSKQENNAEEKLKHDELLALARKMKRNAVATKVHRPRTYDDDEQQSEIAYDATKGVNGDEYDTTDDEEDFEASEDESDYINDNGNDAVQDEHGAPGLGPFAKVNAVGDEFDHAVDDENDEDSGDEEDVDHTYHNDEVIDENDLSGEDSDEDRDHGDNEDEDDEEDESEYGDYVDHGDYNDDDNDDYTEHTKRREVVTIVEYVTEVEGAPPSSSTPSSTSTSTKSKVTQAPYRPSLSRPHGRPYGRPSSIDRPFPYTPAPPQIFTKVVYVTSSPEVAETSTAAQNSSVTPESSTSTLIPVASTVASSSRSRLTGTAPIPTGTGNSTFASTKPYLRLPPFPTRFPFPFPFPSARVLTETVIVTETVNETAFPSSTAPVQATSSPVLAEANSTTSASLEATTSSAFKFTIPAHQRITVPFHPPWVVTTTVYAQPTPSNSTTVAPLTPDQTQESSTTAVSSFVPAPSSNSSTKSYLPPQFPTRFPFPFHRPQVFTKTILVTATASGEPPAPTAAELESSLFASASTVNATSTLSTPAILSQYHIPYPFPTPNVITETIEITATSAFETSVVAALSTTNATSTASAAPTSTDSDEIELYSEVAPAIEPTGTEHAESYPTAFEYPSAAASSSAAPIANSSANAAASTQPTTSSSSVTLHHPHARPTQPYLPVPPIGLPTEWPSFPIPPNPFAKTKDSGKVDYHQDKDEGSYINNGNGDNEAERWNEEETNYRNHWEKEGFWWDRD